MPRLEEQGSSNGRGGGRGGGGGAGKKSHHHHHHHNKNGSLPREVLVSKALSRLLRHAAAQERIPIDNHGYVRMDHLLAWQKLKSMQPRVTFEEVVNVVLNNEKRRFALKYVGDDLDREPERALQEQEQEQGQRQGRPDHDADTETEAETETQRAVSQYDNLKRANGGQLPDDTAHALQRFFIRATQGHSMAAVEAENLLTPITLDDPSSVPETVVHGTFYGAWDAILASGGLKKMSRNHVHFATGPSFQDVMERVGATTVGHGGATKEIPADGIDGQSTTTTTTTSDKGKSTGKDGSESAASRELNQVLGKNKVISGMRSDAQILVYVDIRRALAERPEMKWWRSENGVVLTDGVGVAVSNSTAAAIKNTRDSKEATDGGGDGDDRDGNGMGNEQHGGPQDHDNKVVPTIFFSAAVEIKNGIGLLYESGRGVVNQLPEQLRSRGVPRGKGRGGRGGGGRARGR